MPKYKLKQNVFNELCIKKCVNNADIIRDSEITQPTMYRIVNGANTTIKVVSKLSKYFKIDHKELFDEL